MDSIWYCCICLRKVVIFFLFLFSFYPGVSRISTTPYLEVAVLEPSSPEHGIQDTAIETAVHSGAVDGEVGFGCSDFEGRSSKLLQVASAEEHVAAEMEKSHTRDADGSQLAPSEEFENVAHAILDEDLGLPSDDSQRKQEEQKDGALVSSDEKPSSFMEEKFDRMVVDDLPMDSTIPMQITELEEGEISDDETQIPANDSLDLLPKDTPILSDNNFGNNMSSDKGPTNVPILMDLTCSNIYPEVPKDLASTSYPVHATFGDNSSDVTEGNAGGRHSLMMKDNLVIS